MSVRESGVGVGRCDAGPGRRGDAARDVAKISATTGPLAKSGQLVRPVQERQQNARTRRLRRLARPGGGGRVRWQGRTAAGAARTPGASDLRAIWRSRLPDAEGSRHPSHAFSDQATPARATNSKRARRRTRGRRRTEWCPAPPWRMLGLGGGGDLLEDGNKEAYRVARVTGRSPSGGRARSRRGERTADRSAGSGSLAQRIILKSAMRALPGRRIADLGTMSGARHSAAKRRRETGWMAAPGGGATKMMSLACSRNHATLFSFSSTVSVHVLYTSRPPAGESDGDRVGFCAPYRA